MRQGRFSFGFLRGRPVPSPPVSLPLYGKTMTIKDTFAYNARWDSVGLDCSTCSHFSGPTSWPDTERTIKCIKHNKSLTLELAESGYKEWEWFCKEYKDKSGFPPSVEHFKNIKESLTPKILYRLYGTNGYLLEYSISDLKDAI